MEGELPADFIEEQSGNIAIAPERFKSAGEIKDVCDQMVNADRQRVPRRAKIDGLIDGNPTYTLASLKAKGQGWRSRVNYREAKGLLQSRQSPFYDLVSEVDPCIEVGLDFGKGQDGTEMGQIIARNFTWLILKAWRSCFNFHIPLQQLEMLKHGIGYHIWPGSTSCWTPRTPTTGHVLFPDGVSLNLEEDLDYFMLRDFLPGYAIYNFIRNPAEAERLGWNVDSVWQALAQTSKTKFRSTGANRFNVEEYQREMKAGDIGTSNSRQSGLWLDHLFVKEIETGKISQYTVAEGVTVSPPTKKKPDEAAWNDCLFRRRNKCDEWPLVIFPFDIGSGGDLHTVRGLGDATKDFFELSNRIKNSMADQVMLGSTLTVKQNGPVDPAKLKLMKLGMMSIVPQNLEVVPGVQFQPLAQGPLALDQALRRTLESNNETYMQGTPEPVDRETAMSFQARTQNQGQVAKGVHAMYGSNYEKLLERMLRIVVTPAAAVGSNYHNRLAKAFQDRCKSDGCPPEAFSKISEVNAVLSTGAGSPAARLDAIMQIFRMIYPTTTEARKINIERDMVAALTSFGKVDRYARSHDDNDLPDSDESLAVVENNGLSTGGDALAVPAQNHVEHLKEHLQKAQEVVQAIYAGQMDPQQGLTVTQKFGKHCADHLKFLQANPLRKMEFEQMRQQWVALSVIADKIQQQITESQRAPKRPSPQQQMDGQMQLGMAKLAVDERLGQAKLMSKERIDLTKLRIDSQLGKARLALENGAKAA